MDARKKFQHLLRELFQFDTADLDFGIYRIMNHKREVNAASQDKMFLPIVTSVDLSNVPSANGTPMCR